MPIYYVSLLITTKLCLSHKFRIDCFVIFCNIFFCCRQVYLLPPKRFDYQHKANIETQGYIRGRPIVVRYIVTLIKFSGFSDS